MDETKNQSKNLFENFLYHEEWVIVNWNKDLIVKVLCTKKF